MTDFTLRDSDTEGSSDEELQDAFAQGLLQPGLNQEVTVTRKTYANNVAELKAKLAEMRGARQPWLETLDLTTTAAPLAPDVALQLQETAQRRKNIKENSKGNHVYNPSEDPVLNEFKRENLIHRQAQAAVLEGLQRLKGLGVPTRRPDDYFAEMAKTDEHMQKVRKNLLAKQAGQERSEKVRQLRQHKKIAKRVQTDAKLKQAADKKEMLEKLKRVRKGKSSDLDFLEDKKSKNGNAFQNKVSKKRAQKDKKFGFGGKKRGMKINTRDSSNNMDGFNSSAKTKKNFNNVNNKKQRPGKARRKNAKR